ncbi:MAG: HAMP domain-containing histidine kinase [Planctomycetaceae bacterium]|nr:HAMP domain-containing histidine kinase [Planctomycetaceae bacterium]
MTYRTFKRLLGETSLERKCRFLFGGALMLLISGSFYFYAYLNLKVIQEQYRQRAQLLIGQNLLMNHWSRSIPSNDTESTLFVQQLSNELKPGNLRDFNWKFIHRDLQHAEPEKRPQTPFEHLAYEALFEKGAEFFVYEDKDDKKDQHAHFFERVIATESCLSCHRDQKMNPQIEEAGDVMAMARVSFELEGTQRDIAKNNAILLTMAMVTALLAMGASYVIVRYVVVKPVIHLKEVSDSIAHGDLDQRADIRTGDEFEELSHAFNRMLRHLVTTQDDLRLANTELDHKVDELAQANLSLHEMNQVKNDFLATMSHELRTPLNSILGFSDVLMAAENLNEKQHKYVGNIQASGQNLLSLINDILDLAKIEAGRMEIYLSDFPLPDLIERLTGTMKPLAEKKNIELRWDVERDLRIITQDVGKLQQILFNLLSNAVKFTPEGGRIHVSAYAVEDDMFDVVVADTGIGIPLEDQAVIFERFRQGKNLSGSDNLTREFEGTGLGLSIVKELCKLLKGEVQLESEFGKGSTFTVRLPQRLSLPTGSLTSLEIPMVKLRTGSTGAAVSGSTTSVEIDIPTSPD